jgi:hypothetical protein
MVNGEINAEMVSDSEDSAEMDDDNAKTGRDLFR